nr:DUF3152 domain-containing protein [Nocardioides daedukensis]
MKDGKPITGAWKPTYRVSWRDLGHRISVRTVSTRPGYVTRVFDTPARTIGHRKAWRRTVTYSVQTRGRIVAGVENFKKMSNETLNHPRGWRSDGIAFRRVATGGSMILVLSEARKVPSFSSSCSAQWSCRVGKYVVINQDRWQDASSSWNRAGGSLRDYRHMVVNHETGHWLGWGHRGCSSGAAPVMTQQSIDLQGCRFNPWPLTSELNVPRYR